MPTGIQQNWPCPLPIVQAQRKGLRDSEPQPPHPSNAKGGVPTLASHSEDWHSECKALCTELRMQQWLNKWQLPLPSPSSSPPGQVSVEKRDDGQ